LAGQRHELITLAWPAEFLFGQALVVEHKTIVFPLCPVCNYARFAGVPSQGLQHDAPLRPIISEFSNFQICLQLHFQSQLNRA